LSAQLTGEFSLTDSTGSLLVAVSRDGATWSDAVVVPVVPGAPAGKYAVDLSTFAYAANTIFIQVRLNGSGEMFILDLPVEGQASKKIFPKLEAGQTNTFTYQDLSPAGQTRALDVELTIPNGGIELPVSGVRSLIPQDPVYSTSFNFGADNLIDDSATSL